MQQTIDPLIQELFERKAYIGHIKKKLHPRARDLFVYKIENKIALIDLTKTVDYLKKAKEFAKKLGKENKNILFVGTKQSAAPIIKKLCDENNLMYLSKKWPPGLLTNFETLRKNIEKMNKMKKDRDSGKWDIFPKHEKIKLNKKLNKLLSLYQGVSNLEKLPDALYIVDLRKEKNAVAEAQKLNIPIIAITDTNVDPLLANYPIPANDDYPEVIEKITEEIIKSYLEGRKSNE